MRQNSDNSNRRSPRFADDGDADLVMRFRQGDVAAFAQLVSSHQSRLMRIICRLLDHAEDAEDILQDVFISVYESLPRFRGDASFATWTTTIAVNKCRTLRRRVARKRRLLRFLSTESNHSTVIERDGREAAQEVQQAVRNLPTIYREPVVLYYFEQMSVAQIAQILQCKPNTIDVRLSRARRTLRAVLRRRLEGLDHE